MDMFQRHITILRLMILSLLTGLLISCSSTETEPTKGSDPDRPPMTEPSASEELTPDVSTTRTPVATRIDSPTSETSPSSAIPLQTPTKLPLPHIIKILDWEMIEATSPPLCPSCDPGVTEVQVPQGMTIAIIQIYIQGNQVAESSLTSDLLYADPETLECSLSDDNRLCGFIFGQIFTDQIALEAEYIAGEEHSLKYIITFQTWDSYAP
jgi:hypothetical protein